MFSIVTTSALFLSCILLERAGASSQLRGLSSPCLSTGDVFCQDPQVEGPGSYCSTNSHVCHGGAIPCNCVDSSSEQLSHYMAGGSPSVVTTTSSSPRETTQMRPTSGPTSCLTTGDEFCQDARVQGAASYCMGNSHVCHGGSISCSCAIPAKQQLQNYLAGHDVVSSTNPAAPKTSSGAPATTRVVTETDTAVPETTSVALKTTPPLPPATVENSFMWVEFPEIYDVHQLGVYYDEVYNHVMGNHIGMRYSQVVVRVTTPDDALTGTRNSPLYTHLLDRIAGKLGVICYPDLGTGHGKRDKWVAASPMGSFLDGAIQYAARNGDVFTGVVYDTEEFVGTSSYGKLLHRDNSEIKMAAPNGLTTALTCGFDELTRPDNRGPYFLETVDHLYLQMFNFYNDAGVPIASSPVITPFVTYANDALAMYNYLFSGESDVTAVKDTEPSYAQYSQEGKISMMWSTSFNTSPNCIQPLNGQCGDTLAHYEFGVWEGLPFVSFLSSVVDHFPKAPQGIMQFAFMPRSWE